MGSGRGHLRVIGGALRGLRLRTLPGTAVRPTPERVREALFDILGARVAGAVFLDACSGTGAVGIEALSRGARAAVFVERDPRAVSLLRQNLARTAAEGESRVLSLDLGHAVGVMEEEGILFDVVFVDPPYGGGALQRCLRLIGRSRLIAPGSIVVAEHDQRDPAPTADRLEAVRTVAYGRVALTFLSRR